jgi:hypothetical protein
MGNLLDEDGLIKKTSGKPAYTWLNATFADASAQIKNIKDEVNDTFGHAYLHNTQQNFRWSGDLRTMETPFFDFEDDFFVKTRLWQIGNVARGLLDLYYAVHRKHGGFVFRDDFEAMFRTLAQHNDDLKTEMMDSDRFKQAMAAAGTRASTDAD